MDNYPMLLIFILSLILHPLYSLKDDEEEPCISHLSCETCVIDKGCGWCNPNKCVSLEDNSCFDVVTQCSCHHYDTCGACSARDYCGWCQDTNSCHPLGARPEDCIAFDDIGCQFLRIPVSFEKALLGIFTFLIALIILLFLISVTVQCIRNCRKKNKKEFLMIN